MNSSAHMSYLGTTNRPRRTDYSFVNLMNTILVDNYYDIFTMEEWTHPSGIYFYRIEAGDFTDAKKMVIIK